MKDRQRLVMVCQLWGWMMAPPGGVKGEDEFLVCVARLRGGGYFGKGERIDVV